MAKRQLLKAINRSSILNVIKTHGQIARADIARLTGLSPAAVTFQTAELIEAGLVFEKQEGDSRGGRPPILLALVSDGICVTGIKLTDTQAVLAVTDLNATVLTHRAFPLKARSPQQISDQLSAEVFDLLAEYALPRSHLIGVGVGMAGMIDSENGVCRLSPYNDWNNVPFAEYLADRLDCPVYLDNDVNTLTLVERLYGPGQYVDDFLVVTLGRGVGLGIVANGAIYRGARGGGGEFGHIVVDPNGDLCSCGNRGCLETLVAEPWLIQRAQHGGLQVTTPEELVDAASSGHPVALTTLEQAGEVFGRAIANLINLLDPSLIIISGEGVRLGNYIFPSMREAIDKHTFGQRAGDVDIRIESLSDVAWARGAASLVLSRVFKAPELTTTAAI